MLYQIVVVHVIYNVKVYGFETYFRRHAICIGFRYPIYLISIHIIFEYVCQRYTYGINI